jgi:hypothetical protein
MAPDSIFNFPAVADNPITAYGVASVEANFNAFIFSPKKDKKD